MKLPAKHISRLTLWSLVLLWLAACKTPQGIGYFQDMEDGQKVLIAHADGVKLKPGDQLSIIVTTPSVEITNTLNLPAKSQVIGTTEEVAQGQSQGTLGYAIDMAGNIDFPLLGTLHVAGLTREEVARLVKKQLQDKKLSTEAVVTVDFLNMGFSVMGEVLNPGRYQFTKEKVSLLEALSMAGDLTIYGRRDSVLVMREVDGMHEVHSVNLSKGRSLLESPVYYLQQNDVVYVEPNDYKKRQSTASGNETMTGSFWLSFVSVLTTVAVLLIK